MSMSVCASWSMARRHSGRQIGGTEGDISATDRLRYRGAMSAPNATLRAVRMGMLMSQDDLARAIRAAGQRVGIPNDANKRLVQRWESGATVSPRPVYARALEVVTGLP